LNHIDYSSTTRQRLKKMLMSTPFQPWLKIFSVHWGPNYSWELSGDIRNLAHFLIDECDVDLVHGHSSHHIQGVEVYSGKLIIYGCGDFVDDYALNASYRNDLSAIWRLRIDTPTGDNREPLKITKLEIFPTQIRLFQANLLKPDNPDHRWVHEKVEELSKSFGTVVQKSLGDEGQIVVAIR
jgi:poly-gamma-glutamate capsule biosynthesis protein CapA/YwtB (metallophosphatase superfamily)